MVVVLCGCVMAIYQIAFHIKIYTNNRSLKACLFKNTKWRLDGKPSISGR